MKKITLLLLLIFSFNGFSQNIVVNGNFESGLDSWTTFLANWIPVTATINANNNEANVVSIAGAGGATWHVQLNQVLTPTQIASLTVGQPYKIKFDARGASARPLKLYFGEDGGGFVAIHQQDYNLTTTMATYEANFTVGATFGAMKLGFEGGTSNVDFFIDNVSLELNTTPPALDLLLGFETSETGGIDGGPFGGGPAPVLEPGTGSNTTQVMKITGNPSGEPWQGINLNLTSPTDLSTSQTMTMDVFSADPITFLVKITGGAGTPSNPATVAAQASHPGGSTWQTVSFTFNTPLDSQAPLANGVYNKFVIHTYWVAGETTFFPGGNPIPRPARTFYVDNIRGPLGTPPSIPTPSTPAPVPTTPNAEVYSIYNDTNGYTTNFPVLYDFGVLSAEPNLATPPALNKAYRFNFGIAGWGQGEANANVSSYGFLSFDYWAQPGLPNGFRIVMISNNGGVTEHVYQIGTQEPLVTGQWTKVEIPLSYFTNIGFASTNFFQWKVSPFNDSVANAGFVYIDNLMFTVNSVLSNPTFTASQVRMYPNPSKGIVNIDAIDVIDTVSVVNMIGQIVFTKEINSNTVNLDLSELSSGQYLINLTSSTGKVVKKFIKN
jgi:hypothetical protein